MTPSPDQLVLKLRSPLDILEAVPYVLEFEPTECLVALSLRGPRQRLGLTTRVDLVDPMHVDLVADKIVAALDADGAEAVILVAYASEAPRADALVDAMLTRLNRAHVGIAEALRVVAGLWTSYTCDGPCCPPGGTPVPDRVRNPGRVATTAVAAGRQVLSGRDVLTGALAPVQGLLRTSMGTALDRELERYLGVVDRDEMDAYAVSTLALVRTFLDRLAAMDEAAPAQFDIGVDDAARMIVGLLDKRARDACIDGWADSVGELGLPPGLDQGLDPHMRPVADKLWTELVRRAVRPGLAAPVATLLAWNRYVHHGGGALMSVALQRVLKDTPDYYMAMALDSLLGGAVSPAEFAALVASGEQVGVSSAATTRRRAGARRPARVRLVQRDERRSA